MRRHLLSVTILAGIIIPAGSALAALPHTPSAGVGSIGIRLAAVPAAPRTDPLARSYIVGRLAPGTSIRSRVEISNSTGSTADVAVYPAAATLRRGNFAFAPGRSRNELSTWTTVRRGLLRLPPGGSAFETLTIKVPRQASAGERYAVVWAEVSTPAPAAGGVTLVNRVGVRMYLTVGRGGVRPSIFAIGPLTAERSATGVPLVVATVRETGQRALEINGSLTLTRGPGGLSAGPFPVEVGRALARNDSESVVVRLDRRLPRGPWHAELRLGSGLIHRDSAATITFPRFGGTAHTSVARSGSRHLTIAAGGILVLLAAAAVLSLRRRTLATRPTP